VVRSRPHGHVAGGDGGDAAAPEASKLGMTRAFTDTALGEDLGVADACEDELYDKRWSHPTLTGCQALLAA
jgi:hypothetical protein